MKLGQAGTGFSLSSPQLTAFHARPKEKMLLAFSLQNISNENEVPQEWWQALLWIEADFVVTVADGIMLSESHWCIIELATSLAAWLRSASAQGPDFYYTSMDDEQEGLLWFRCGENDRWVIGSAWQELENITPCNFQELQNAARKYIEDVLQETASYLSRQVADELNRACA